MEERKLNEKESLELIAQMIQNTKNRLETNCGNTYGSYSPSSQEQELTFPHVISSRVSRLIWTK